MSESLLLSCRYLEYTLDEEMHSYEALATINSVARNVAGQALAWNFMRAHWDDIKHGQVVIYNLLCSGGDDLCSM